MKVKNFYFLFIAFIVNVGYSQNITINWEGKKQIYDNGVDTNLYPFFSNANYSISEGIPTFSYNEATSSYGKVSLSNLNWQEISTSDLGNIDRNLIPETNTYSASINYARKTPYLSVIIKTLKKEANKYYRLNSFSINVDTQSSPANATYGVTTVTNSVLSSGTWYKIKVPKSGVYKLDRNFFQQNGINISNINPKNIRIYGNGGKMLPEYTSSFRFEDLQENAIQVKGEEDGVFNTDDYVLFYAQGPDYWIRNGTNTKHKKNIYEDYAYYFLNFDIGEGKRINSVSFTNPNATVYTSFDDYQFYDIDKNNLNGLGRIWLDDNMAVTNTKEIEFPVNQLLTSSSVTWRLSGVGNYLENSKLNLTYNGNAIYSATLAGTNTYALVNSNGNAATGNNLKFSLSFDNSLNPTAEYYLDYLEVLYKQSLSFNGSQMNFRTLDNIENGSIYGFKFSNTSGMEQVWDVSDYTNVRKLESSTADNTTYSYQFTSDTFKNELVAFKESAAYTPEFIGRVTNQNLHSLSNVDYIIVTVPEFTSQANRLKQFHQQTNGLNVSIVTVNQIYNEFSSGGQDLTAIRDFLRFLYKNDGNLKYALMLGSASYDFKNIKGENYNLIPSYQSFESNNYQNSFVTDDYLAILDDNEAYSNEFSNANLSSSQLDISIGRMTARNNSEAKISIDKAIKYSNGDSSQSTPFGDWRLKTAIIVDKDTYGGVPFHTAIDNTVSSYIENNVPIMTNRKLYMDAFQADYSAGGEKYPQVTEEIKNAFNNGTLLVNYFGHGGPIGLSQSRIFTINDINNLDNFNTDFTRLPLFITVSCELTIWDNPGLNSFGDRLYHLEKGGATAMITTSREIYVSYGLGVNPILIQNLFKIIGNKYQSFGEALRLTKISYPNTENYKIAVLGDPAQSLARPPRSINLTKINNEDASSFNGTIRALDLTSFEGEVLTGSNNIDTSFNGTLQASLYDKPVEKSTLTIDPILNYTEQINSVFKGSTTVKNGKFKIEFYVPKDINYTVGNGKLVLYADNKRTDAANYNKNIKVGDINPDGVNDTEGPGIKLYMNNIHFANGGITDNSPYLLACVTDSTGINSTGSGIGHDITAILDGVINNTMVLNEFFNSGELSPCTNPNLKDYQKGKIWYRLYDLDQGNHTIKLKVWDINNNSSTATLDFIVAENGDQHLVINRLLNWPNPFTNRTYFHFEHNCPDALEAQIQIFTLSGKLVKTIRQSVNSEPFHEGYRTDKFGIPWDGKDDYGDNIGKGTYIYRATIKGTSDQCVGSVSKIEKLVILK